MPILSKMHYKIIIKYCSLMKKWTLIQSDFRFWWIWLSVWNTWDEGFIVIEVIMKSCYGIKALRNIIDLFSFWLQ